jgi:hypothetical protein
MEVKASHNTGLIPFDFSLFQQFRPLVSTRQKISDSDSKEREHPAADADTQQVFQTVCVPREFTGSSSWQVEIRYLIDKQGRPLFVIKDLAAAVGMTAATRGTYLAGLMQKTSAATTVVEEPAYLFAARAFEDRGRLFKFTNSPLLVCSAEGIQKLPKSVCAKKRGRAFDIACLLQPLCSSREKLAPRPLAPREQALPQLKVAPEPTTPSPPSSPMSQASTAADDRFQLSLQNSISTISLLTTTLASQSRKRGRVLFGKDEDDNNDDDGDVVDRLNPKPLFKRTRV